VHLANASPPGVRDTQKHQDQRQKCAAQTGTDFEMIKHEDILLN
jgi:hypothetical protein